jgi:hypothetical protein
VKRRRWSDDAYRSERVRTNDGCHVYFAYFLVQSFAMRFASWLFSRHCFAIVGSSGSSGFGFSRRSWIERHTLSIWRAGDPVRREHTHKKQR